MLKLNIGRTEHSFDMNLVHNEYDIFLIFYSNFHFLVKKLVILMEHKNYIKVPKIYHWYHFWTIVS